MRSAGLWVVIKLDVRLLGHLTTSNRLSDFLERD
jgi:hypothetical protein